ncbi:MAG: hypothetical protein EOS21_11890 [Mesorhizobium sp.]|nr:MAG: hypothetical protein EOS21_11890 [Mesorhizobium sp.]
MSPYVSDVYTLPPGSTATPNTTIESAKFNTLIDDLATAQNAARPVVGGGTGGITAVAGNDGLNTQGANIASAATTNLAAATGVYLNITGTTTITAFGTVTAGSERVLTFTGILILTHNATSLILPGAASITTAAGDVATMRSLGGGNWKCVGYLRANGSNPGNSISGTTIVLKQSAAPAPTAEGDIQWDTDDDRIVIGDGAAQAVFSKNPATTVDNTVPRFDGTKGVTQTSGVTISDTNAVTAAGGYYVGAARVGGVPDAVLEDQKATGTDGGTFSAGAWRTRTLNTEVLDPSGLITLSANRFTPTVAGWVEWSAPSYAVGTNIQTRLQNITDGTTAAMGVSDNNRASSTAPGLGGGPVVAGKAYEIQHQCDAGAVTEGFGIASGFGSHEVYTRVKFWRSA